MDFRFKYRRHPATQPEAARESAVELDTAARMRGLAIGFSIPFQLASGPLGGWLLGAWLDRALNTHYWMILLILLGTAGSLKLTIDTLIRMGKP